LGHEATGIMTECGAQNAPESRKVSLYRVFPYTPWIITHLAPRAISGVGGATDRRSKKRYVRNFRFFSLHALFILLPHKITTEVNDRDPEHGNCRIVSLVTNRRLFIVVNCIWESIIATPAYILIYSFAANRLRSTRLWLLKSDIPHSPLLCLQVDCPRLISHGYRELPGMRKGEGRGNGTLLL
jgi:hypothetical protein